VAPPSPARESVTESPGRRGLFGKMKSQKTSKMFGGVKNIVSFALFFRSYFVIFITLLINVACTVSFLHYS
jgi:hypothetical protein